jgi:hypothetical protein
LLLFESAWKSQSADPSKAQKPGMRVFKAAWQCFGHMFMTSIFLQIIWLATALSLPSYFLRQMISFANNPDEPLQNGILYAVFMFVAQLTSVTCLHNQVGVQLSQLSNQCFANCDILLLDNQYISPNLTCASQWNLAVNVGLQLRSALSSMVFRKAMRLRRLTGSGGNTAGQLVNIISTDPERVIMACNVRESAPRVTPQPPLTPFVIRY